MKKLWSKIIGITLVLAMCIALTGCNGTPDASGNNVGEQTGSAENNAAEQTQKEKDENGQNQAGADGEKVLVGLVMLTQSNPYFVASAERMRKNAEERGWEFKLYDSDWNTDAELQAFEDLITLGADIIFVDNVEPKGVVAAVKRAYDAGIPTIGIDSLIDEAAPVSTVVTAAARDGAWECGLWFAEKNKGEPVKAAVISGKKGNPIGQLRRDGLFAGVIEGMYKAAGKTVDKETVWAETEAFEAQLTEQGKAKHPQLDFEVVTQGWGNWNAEGGLNAMQDIVIAHPEINLLLTENDDMAMGAMNAIAEANLSDRVTIVAGADGQKEAYALIKEGRYGATSENNPIKIADMAYEYADKIVKDGQDPWSFPKEVMTDAVCVNPSNVDEYYSADSPF